jgi:hypothetical protein
MVDSSLTDTKVQKLSMQGHIIKKQMIEGHHILRSLQEEAGVCFCEDMGIMTQDWT